MDDFSDLTISATPDSFSPNPSGTIQQESSWMPVGDPSSFSTFIPVGPFWSWKNSLAYLWGSLVWAYVNSLFGISLTGYQNAQVIFSQNLWPKIDIPLYFKSSACHPDRWMLRFAGISS